MKKTITSVLLVTLSVLLMGGFAAPGNSPDGESIEKFSKELFGIIQNSDRAGFAKLILTQDDIGTIFKKSSHPDSLKKEIMQQVKQETKEKQLEILNAFDEAIKSTAYAAYKKMAWDDIEYKLEREDGIYSLRLKIWTRLNETYGNVSVRSVVWVPGKGWRLTHRFYLSEETNFPRYRSFRSQGAEVQRLTDSLLVADSTRMMDEINAQEKADSIRMADSIINAVIEVERLMDSIAKADSVARAKKGVKKPK